MSIPDENKEEKQENLTLPDQFLVEIKALTEELKALQTEELNRYKSAILKEIHEIRQQSY